MPSGGSTPEAVGAKGTNIVERIAYPADIARIRAEDNERARAIQQANAQKFQAAFAQGLAVTGFERSETEGTYLLEPWK